VPRKIAFFLTGGARSIRGGLKVLFIYANFLAQHGLEVTIFFPATNSTNRGEARVARAMRYIAGKLSSAVYLPRTWFELHPSIKTHWVWRSPATGYGEFDVSIIADRAVGADILEAQAAGAGPGGKLLYLFQEYEYYMTGGETTRRQIETLIRRVDTVVAISPAARDVAETIRGPEGVYLVTNGVELERFFVSDHRPFRARKSLGFAFREEAFKRTEDVVAALSQLRARGLLEGITCWAYGTRRWPGLPDWIRYHHRPSASQLRDLFNTAAIFVVASLYEGWGLPGAEAMACGAALVTTRNGGCEAYATHLVNALMCSPGNVAELAEAIQRLLSQPELAAELAAKGHESIQKFTWDSACAEFLQCTSEVVNTA
jgi:glycosyltransferase involved in cell wall biosynthesis